jgi:hypothetical protein
MDTTERGGGGVAHYELYVTKADGTRYCRATLRCDESDARERMDREARHWMARPSTLAVSVERVVGRTSGYRSR